VKAKQRVDAIALRNWIAQHDPQHAYIGRGQAMPRQGSSSGFKYGRVIGAIEAVIACTGVPMTIVEPALWKKFHGSDKESGRQQALQLFPAARRARPQEGPRQRRRDAARAVRGPASSGRGRSMKRRNGQEQKLADDARLLRASKKFHREEREAVLAGPHRAVLAELFRSSRT
jgi:uncharacterized protein YbjT (DUF2867 family)